jgi:amino acid transporter
MTELDNDPTHTGLRRHAIGVPGIVFFVVAAAAPLAATVGGSPITFMATGVGAPGAYVIAGLVLLLFAVGYGAMCRHVTSAGGFAALLEQGLGRVAGFAGASVALLAYNCMLIGLYGFFGFITSAVVTDLTGADIDWKLWTLIAWALVALLACREINLSARVLGVLIVGEVLALLVFDLAVLGQGGASGVNLESFRPDNVFVDGLGVAMLFAAASFVGFEATAIYGEEARNPERTVPRATYVAVILIAVFYSLSTWSIALAYGSEGVQQAAVDNPAGLVFATNEQYVGSWATTVMSVLMVTSTFAVLLAFHNTLSRYVFALGRARVLPRTLGEAHPRWQSPHRASSVGTVVSAVVLVCFGLGGSDPFGQLYAWLVGVGTLGILALQASTCIAVVAYFLRRNPEEFQVWRCGVAPILGAAGLFTMIYLAWANWDLLTGATTGIPTRLPWLVVVAVAVGIGWAWASRSSESSIAGAFGADTRGVDQAPDVSVPQRLATGASAATADEGTRNMSGES